MKDNLCEAMLRPCDALRGGGECQMCQITYLVKELRKIKDELKLLNVRLTPHESEGELDYGKMFSSKHPKPRNIPGVGGKLDEPTIR
jgi:hypothetical protein